MGGKQRLTVKVGGQVGEHLAGLVDDGGVLGVQAVDEPAHQRDLAEELSAREDMQVGGASLVTVGFAEAFKE